MFLERLRILHFLKKRPPEEQRELDQNFFQIDTCQRKLWVFSEHDASAESLASLQKLGYSLFTGYDAYRFLLRVATGLESEVLGETDIFGQIKNAWHHYEQAQPSSAQKFGPWIQRLFEDTKEIRTRFLQNSGEGSYGSLVRKLLRSCGANPGDPVLLVGAGNIARSILPWLSRYSVLISNRSRQNLIRMHEEALAQWRSSNTLQILLTEEETRSAWKNTKHAILCIPVTPDDDLQRLNFWQQGGVERTLIHLGGFRKECESWNTLPNFHALDDLFRMKKNQDSSRSLQLLCAFQACDEKARARFLGSSMAV